MHVTSDINVYILPRRMQRDVCACPDRPQPRSLSLEDDAVTPYLQFRAPRQAIPSPKALPLQAPSPLALAPPSPLVARQEAALLPLLMLALAPESVALPLLLLVLLSPAPPRLLLA